MHFVCNYLFIYPNLDLCYEALLNPDCEGTSKCGSTVIYRYVYVDCVMCVYLYSPKNFSVLQRFF